jgi:hypothetical protein
VLHRAPGRFDRGIGLGENRVEPLRSVAQVCAGGLEIFESFREGFNILFAQELVV